MTTTTTHPRPVRLVVIGIVGTLFSFAMVLVLNSIIPGESNAGYRLGISWIITATSWFPLLDAQADAEARRRGRPSNRRRRMIVHGVITVVSAVLMGLLP